jgi:TetR/AcrR family transcriptional regulator
MRTKDSGTETAILEAAHKVFLAKGLDGARMQEIADEAKINKAMLHYYYRSKELLFIKVFRSEALELMQSTTQLLQADIPILDKIPRLVENDLSIAMRKPDLAIFVMNELKKNGKLFFSDGHLDHLRAAFETFKKQLKKEVREGKIRDVSAEHLIINIISLVQFPFIGEVLLRQLLAKGDGATYRKMLMQRREEVVQLILATLKP